MPLLTKTTKTLKQNLTNLTSNKHTRLTIFIVAFASIGIIALLATKAATPFASIEPENGTLSRTDLSISDGTASGGKAVQFTAAPVAGACIGAIHTPGGPDGMGGCWPGPQNTGYPKGLPGDTRTPVTLTNYTGPCTIRTDDVVIDSMNVDCGNQGLVLYSKNLTIKNSKVDDIVFLNDDAASVTITDSEINGGNQTEMPTIGRRNVKMTRVNAYGGQHTVHCYGNCDVQDSWLHDQYEAPGPFTVATEPHQNGFLTNDGNGFIIRHNTAHCSSRWCTADVAFTDDGLTYDATIDKNLFMPSPGAYCLYPATGSKGNIMYQMRVTNNIFKRGTNNKCATFGPLYGWDTPNNNPGTTGYQNVWSNNKWEDGTILNP